MLGDPRGSDATPEVPWLSAASADAAETNPATVSVTNVKSRRGVSAPSRMTRPPPTIWVTIVGMTAPSGSSNASSGDVEPEIVFLWAYDIDDRLSIAGNAGIAAPVEDGDRFTQGKASFSIAYAFTDRVGGYAEYFGIYRNTQHTDAAHSVNGGLTYLINDNFQLDARVGAGLNEEADDFFAGVGFASRW